MHPREQASSALGWVSIACWILVYTPQIYENYHLKSGEGLSVLFVLIWLAGDVCNLVGAGMAGLIPTVIILAIYYTLCDIVLLFQIYYYRQFDEQVATETSTIDSSTTLQSQSEQTPLLAQQSLNSSPTKPAPHKNILTAPDPSTGTMFLPVWLSRGAQYFGGIAFVTLAGLAAWWVAGKSESRGSDEVFDWTSQILGWASAAMYIGSRIPQILKNRQTKCEGLSLALFLFAILGNITYVLSICVISMARDHIVLSVPWLAGSGLTILVDFFVLGQFFHYRGEEGPLHLESHAHDLEQRLSSNDIERMNGVTARVITAK